MRRLVLILAASLLMGGVYTPDIGPGPLGFDQSGGWKTIWSSPLSKNGPASATALPSGFPTPAILWWGPSPLVNYGSGGGTFTETGSTTAAYSPYCNDGVFTDMTACLVAREFAGAEYYELSNAVGDINSTHLSACAIFQSDNTGAIQDIAGKRADAGDDGWSLGFTGTSPETAQLYIETDAANISRTVAGTGTGYWTILCGTAAAAGNTYAYNNGTVSAATAYPAGTATSATAFRVGTSSAGATLFDGAILAVYVWPGTTLTAAQVRSFTQYWEGLLPVGEYTADTVTSAGKMCQWMGASTSKLMCFGDDHALIGGVVPPGLTGGGSGGGWLAVNSFTNVILQSRDPSASWAVTGTLLGATSTANSPFWDGASFPVTALVDDDPAGAEYMAQGFDMTALATGSKVTVVVYARSVSGTDGLDLRFYEDVGGGCTTAQTDYDALALTASWKTFVKTYTITDGDCTSFIVYTGPVSAAGAAHDFADATETGDMYAIYQVFYGSGGGLTNVGTPPIYIETTTAAASAGQTYLQWLNNANASVLQDLATSKSRVQVTYTPGTAMSSVAAGYMFYIHSGAYAAYQRMQHATGGSQASSWRTNAGSNVSTIAAPSWTAGTSTTFRMDIDWGSDVYKQYQDDVLGDTDSAAETPPAGIDSLDISYANAAGGGSGHWIKNFTYRRRK